jgi:hypothetical protein
VFFLLCLLLVICIGAVGFTVIGITAARRLVSGGFGGGHNETSGAIFTVGGTIYAVFLAFLVISSWQAHDAANANAADEASLLCTLYRGSTAMDPASGDKLRAAIRRYTHAVITDEWPIQARTGGASEKARSAGQAMFAVFAAMPAPVRQNDAAINAIQLQTMAQIQADRNRRTLQAQESLSPVIWATAITTGFLVLVMSFVLYPDRDGPHVVMSSMLAIMVFALIYVVFIFSSPFGGMAPLQPDKFAHSLEVYGSVDRMLAGSGQIAER